MNAVQQVLGGLLLDSSAYWRIADIVTEDDFLGRDRELFAYIRDELKAGRTPDAVTASEAGFEDAIDLAKAVFSVANIASYAKLVAEDGERRRVREAGKRIAVANTYAEAQQILAAARPMQAARIKTASAALVEFVDALQARFDADGSVTGIPTGLASLDELTSGWQPGDLVGIGGDTSSGKTAFAVQASLAAGRTFYCSLEMTAAQLIERAVCNVGNIPARWLRFPKEAPEHALSMVTAAAGVIKTCGLIVDDQPGLNADQICSRIRQAHLQEPLRLAVVDHLMLVNRPHRNEAVELGQIAIAFKNIAKELHIPVLLLLQLNRAGKTDRPDLSAIRNSGEIEEALDTCVMVYRDEYYRPDSPLRGYAEFIVRKQRQGERNVTAWAKSMLSQMRFESCDPPERPIEQAATHGGYGGFASRFGQGRQSRPAHRTGSDH